MIRCGDVANFRYANEAFEVLDKKDINEGKTKVESLVQFCNVTDRMVSFFEMLLSEDHRTNAVSSPPVVNLSTRRQKNGKGEEGG